MGPAAHRACLPSFLWFSLTWVSEERLKALIYLGKWTSKELEASFSEDSQHPPGAVINQMKLR